MRAKQAKSRTLKQLFAVYVACGGSASYGCEDLHFSAAWLREPPPVASMAAAYVLIENQSEEAIAISDIKSDCCSHIMAHETLVRDGNSKMVHLESLDIPAASKVTLAPLGKHLMLGGFQAPLMSGESVDITFTCSDGSKQAVRFPIRRQ
ncbi:MAG: copper chaperone PCu(A)C [Pseudomonadota bacterium]